MTKTYSQFCSLAMVWPAGDLAILQTTSRLNCGTTRGVRLEMKGALRELTLFNLAIDSKLGACNLVRLRLEDIRSGDSIKDGATVKKQTDLPSSS